MLLYYTFSSCWVPSEPRASIYIIIQGDFSAVWLPCDSIGSEICYVVGSHTKFGHRYCRFNLWFSLPSYIYAHLGPIVTALGPGTTDSDLVTSLQQFYTKADRDSDDQWPQGPMWLLTSPHLTDISDQKRLTNDWLQLTTTHDFYWLHIHCI